MRRTQAIFLSLCYCIIYVKLLWLRQNLWGHYGHLHKILDLSVTEKGNTGLLHRRKRCKNVAYTTSCLNIYTGVSIPAALLRTVRQRASSFPGLYLVCRHLVGLERGISLSQDLCLKAKHRKENSRSRMYGYLYIELNSKTESRCSGGREITHLRPGGHWDWKF